MAIMEDFEEGDRICLENMDGLKVGEGHYDFGRAKQRGFKHRKYVAEPYVGTVGWFQFNKGAKKTVHSKDGTTTLVKEMDENSYENAYECLVLTKVSRVTDIHGNIEEKFFSINIPVGVIPQMNVAFQHIAKMLDNTAGG
jgi:hypothetical protein